MRTRNLVCLLSLAFVLFASLAGCIGSSDNGEDEANPSDPSAEDHEALDWWLSDCQVVVPLIPVDEDALAEHLPEGFQPLSGEQAFGLPPDLRGEAVLGLEAFQCTSGAGLEGEVQDLQYGALFSPVRPPENLTHPDADVYLYKWDTLVPDEDRRQLLQDHGLPAVDGTTDLSGFEQTPTGHLFDVSLTLGDATFQFTGGAAEANEEFREGFTFLEFQQGENGFAQWHSMENEAVQGNSGIGTVQLPDGHWTQDVVGAPASQAFIVASPEVHFTEGGLRLP